MKDALVQPIDLFTSKGLLVPRALVNPNKKTFVLSIINMGTQSIRIHKNTIIANLNPIPNEQKLDIVHEKREQCSSATSQNIHEGKIIPDTHREIRGLRTS